MLLKSDSVRNFLITQFDSRRNYNQLIVIIILAMHDSNTNSLCFLKRLWDSQIVRIKVFSIRRFYAGKIPVVGFVHKAMLRMFCTERTVENNTHILAEISSSYRE